MADSSTELGCAAGGIGGIFVVIIGIICLCMWGCPHYEVYKQNMAGQAKFAEAENSRNVIVLEAKAKHEAAKELALAEVERSKGVAEANKIIGDSLKKNHEYLMWLWIHSLSETGNKDIIYVPTEGGLPILEAGRFKQPVKVETHPPEEKK